MGSGFNLICRPSALGGVLHWLADGAFSTAASSARARACLGGDCGDPIAMRGVSSSAASESGSCCGKLYEPERLRHLPSSLLSSARTGAPPCLGGERARACDGVKTLLSSPTMRCRTGVSAGSSEAATARMPLLLLPGEASAWHGDAAKTGSSSAHGCIWFGAAAGSWAASLLRLSASLASSGCFAPACCADLPLSGDGGLGGASEYAL